MEDLQGLLEKINRDGVEKAEAEARRIVDEAKAKADALVKNATEEADRFRRAAQKDSEDYARRAAETIGQAARDIVIGVKDAITALLEKTLVQDVDRALADEAVTAQLAATAVKDLTGPAEITCGPKLAKALVAQLAARTNLTLVTDDAAGSGFTVKVDGGRVEHAFTGDVIAAELAKRLRPDLAKLLK